MEECARKSQIPAMSVLKRNANMDLVLEISILYAETRVQCQQGLPLPSRFEISQMVPTKRGGGFWRLGTAYWKADRSLCEQTRERRLHPLRRCKLFYRIKEVNNQATIIKKQSKGSVFLFYQTEVDDWIDTLNAVTKVATENGRFLVWKVLGLIAFFLNKPNRVTQIHQLKVHFLLAHYIFFVINNSTVNFWPRLSFFPRIIFFRYHENKPT